jgi:hypothetical protein
MENDPWMIIRHHSTHALIPLILDLEKGMHLEDLEARLASIRVRLGSEFDKMSNGKTDYKHTASMNPSVAANYVRRIDAELRVRVTAEVVAALHEDTMITTDNYAIETGRPENTRKALHDQVQRLFGS